MQIEIRDNDKRTAKPGDILMFPQRTENHSLYLIVYYSKENSYGLVNLTGTSSAGPKSRYSTIDALLKFHKTGEVLSQDDFKIVIERI